MYKALRALLFRLDAERSHDIALAFLSLVSRSRPLLRLLEAANGTIPDLGREYAGLRFSNPVGLAAGLDKNASAFPALAALGFGWIEVGTVTPKPQPGQPKKRLFRLVEDNAIINRMGFNSDGLEPFITNARQLRRNTSTLLGINIGKNAATPMESATTDYLVALDTVYGLADYVTINISSPNTAALRNLQGIDSLDGFLRDIAERRMELAQRHGKSVPLALKIAPDLSPKEIGDIARLLEKHGFDAVIATNTTISRPTELRSRWREETGGLSGAPLTELSKQVIIELRRCLDGRIPIIGVGGIMCADDALQKMKQGADLVQLYTGFIYHGPQLIKQILLGLEHESRSMHSSKR